MHWTRTAAVDRAREDLLHDDRSVAAGDVDPRRPRPGGKQLRARLAVLACQAAASGARVAGARAPHPLTPGGLAKAESQPVPVSLET